MTAFIEGPDLIVVLVIVLVLFGGAKLPQLARSLGEAKKELDKGLHEEPPAAPVSAPPVQAAQVSAPPVQVAPKDTAG